MSLSLGVVVALVFGLGIVGAGVGLAFPKWNAEALLETPGIAAPVPEARQRPGEDLNEVVVKTQYVTLAEFRKVMAAYSSDKTLGEYLTAAQIDGAAAQRLLAQSTKAAFWAGVASPVLPFSRRDAREFGDLKDAASDSLVGIDLVTDARTEALAGEMLGVMSSYVRNALIRERIRAWILKYGGEAPARQSALRAEIIDAQMKIEVMGRRVQDFKTILARYPDAAKVDTRQVVAITDGADRFLSPLVQLVAAETSITQLRETIARKERQARQLELQQRYFELAAKALQEKLLAAELIPALGALATGKFEKMDVDAEWAREVVFRIQADVDGFATALKSFGIRNEPRLAPVASRDPLRLAAFGAAAALLLLGLLAFVRTSLKAARATEQAIE